MVVFVVVMFLPVSQNGCNESNVFGRVRLVFIRANGSSFKSNQNQPAYQVLILAWIFRLQFLHIQVCIRKLVNLCCLCVLLSFHKL